MYRRGDRESHIYWVSVVRIWDFIMTQSDLEYDMLTFKMKG